MKTKDLTNQNPEQEKPTNQQESEKSTTSNTNEIKLTDDDETVTEMEAESPESVLQNDPEPLQSEPEIEAEAVIEPEEKQPILQEEALQEADQETPELTAKDVAEDVAKEVELENEVVKSETALDSIFEEAPKAGETETNLTEAKVDIIEVKETTEPVIDSTEEPLIDEAMASKPDEAEVTEPEPEAIVVGSENEVVLQTELQEEVLEIEEVVAEVPVAKSEEIGSDVKDVSEDEEGEEIDEDEEGEEIYQNLSRAELIDLLENAVQEDDVQAVKVKVALLKVAYLAKEKDDQQTQYQSFINSGGIPEDYSPETDQLSERFNIAFNIYREKKQRYNEQLEREKFTNLEEKKRILEELKALISSEETLKKTYDEFKLLQEKWKQIGMVPKNEINQLWQNYHFLVEKFFDKVKINKELKDLDLRKNLERKIELCEKAEELLIETSILKSFKLLQQYHEDWKEIGPVPQDKKDEIWERFKTASDQINERRREYYSEKQGELEANHLAKSALCEKAEKLVSASPDNLRKWQIRTNEINDLLRVWKTIGPAPKKVNNEIWNRFKTCLDSHFTSYKEFLSKLKDQQLNNYNIKLDLCAQAEAMMHSTDWRTTSQELIKLQREWRDIGPVPRKFSDKVWKRFRAACDEFFKRKSEYFSSLSKVEEDNLKKKEELITALKEFNFSDSKAENLESLKNFQREWLEIGHVPIKEKDRLQNSFRSVINKHFERLKINAAEINAMSYKNRMESIKETPDGGRMLSRERSALQIKISKMQEDIKLWENNIGFLAESKNANIVKVEFQKKIDQAKQELALMEAKLRYLREM